jgi:hypothetical protein
MNKLDQLLKAFVSHHGINDKSRLAGDLAAQFGLTKDRSVYYCDEFAIRFSSSAGGNFSNTVLSLSNLRKVDHIPFIVCIVTPSENHVLLANTTMLRKISHSSQQLRVDNIKGSFNGSDILRDFEGIPNVPANFERLFDIHSSIGFDGNLVRLVENTSNISPTGHKYLVSDVSKRLIMEAPERAIRFVASPDATTLKLELDEKVNRFRNEIVLAALIENVNVRGRIIEYLIAGEDDSLRGEIIRAIQSKSAGNGIPAFKTENALGDYQRVFDNFLTETDVKTKIMILSSNPKAYNLDKMLEFLSHDKSVFMFYFVGVDPTRIVNTVLISMFQTDLLRSTILLKHWAGRNSRGVSQFEGKKIGELILKPRPDIQVAEAVRFLERIIAL